MADPHPRTLIAILNARHRADWRNAIRRTWLPQVPQSGLEAFFFVGRGEPVADHQDVIELDCDDGYKSIPEKVREITRWARRNGYYFMLKCDDDVIFRPNDFATSGYAHHMYSGRANRPPQPYTVPFGFCYVLNTVCMDIISSSPLPTGHPEPFDDERWVAEMLWNQQIALTNVPRYKLYHTVGYNRPPDGAFAVCIHLAEPQAVKLKEFDRAFALYGEDTGKPSRALINGRELVRQHSRYEADGLTINWWDEDHD